MSPYRTASALGLCLSIGILMLSYAAIATYTATPWLWSVIVHESGDRTLGQTILYYEHAARELPLDLILGLSIGAGALFVFPKPRGASHELRSPRLKLFALGLAGVIGVILAGTLWTGGWAMLYENVLQFPTRPGEPLVWGGHWRYHLLSHLTLMLVSFGLAGPLILADGRSKGNPTGLSLFAAFFAVFLAFTVLFVPSAESFTDPVFLGHQAREVLTHSVVTIPIAWSVCLLLARSAWNTPGTGAAPVAASLVAGGIGATVGLFVLVGSLATSAASQGQSESLAVLIFPHFFEHAFSYVVATLAAGVVFQWWWQRSGSPNPLGVRQPSRVTDEIPAHQPQTDPIHRDRKTEPH